MPDSEEILKIAISMTPGINAQVVRYLAERGITLEDFFRLDMAALRQRLGGSSSVRFQTHDREEALFRARKEAQFISRHKIRTRFLLDDDYPALLREIPDAPVLLYVLGDADLDALPSIAMVGTRRCTQYGLNFCDAFVDELALLLPDSTVVSGLAYGIDSASHRAALRNSLATVAVVAHGLDMVYPAAHRDLACRILDAGGAIVSEYPSGVKPFRNNFLQRNRIVAGLSEVTLVVESEVKGGAMSTANLAFNYSREVMALPGRYTDVTSSGCNHLIAADKAHIFTSVAALSNLMGWHPGSLPSLPVEKVLFPEMQGDTAVIYETLKKNAMPMTVDALHHATSIPLSQLMSTLTEMEFDGLISRLPGSRYELS